MEGSSAIVLLLGAVIGIVMLFAQLKLVAIARTLENILAELQRNRPTAGGQVQNVSSDSEDTVPARPRTLAERLGGKL